MECFSWGLILFPNASLHMSDQKQGLQTQTQNSKIKEIIIEQKWKKWIKWCGNKSLIIG